MEDIHISKADLLVKENNYGELKKYISECDEEMRSDINIYLFSLACHNDNLVDFLYELSHIDGLDEFKYDKKHLLANVFVSSCGSSEDVEWFIQKVKKYGEEPFEVVSEACEEFGYSNVGRYAPLLMHMLSERLN